MEDEDEEYWGDDGPETEPCPVCKGRGTVNPELCSKRTKPEWNGPKSSSRSMIAGCGVIGSGYGLRLGGTHGGSCIWSQLRGLPCS